MLVVACCMHLWLNTQACKPHACVTVACSQHAAALHATCRTDIARCLRCTLHARRAGAPNHRASANRPVLRLSAQTVLDSTHVSVSVTAPAIPPLSIFRANSSSRRYARSPARWPMRGVEGHAPLSVAGRLGEDANGNRARRYGTVGHHSVAYCSKCGTGGQGYCRW